MIMTRIIPNLLSELAHFYQNYTTQRSNGNQFYYSHNLVSILSLAGLIHERVTDRHEP